LPDGIRRLLGRRRYQVALNVAFGLGLLALLAHSVPIADIARHLRPPHAELLIALVAVVLLSQLARAARWRWLVQPLTQVKLYDALWVNATTQLFNYIIPVRAGEAIRLVWLSRRRGVGAATAAGVLVIDHTLDLLAVIGVLAVGFGLRLAALQPRLPTATTLGFALVGAVIMLAAIAGVAIAGPALAHSRLMPAWLRERICHHAVGFREGALVVRCGRRLPALLITSAVAVVFDGFAFALLFKALGLAVPIVSAIITQVALLYAYLLPAAPGYVGTLEAGGTLLLANGLGLDRGAAAAAMVVWHGLGAAVVIGLGLLAVHQLRRSGQLIFSLKAEATGKGPQPPTTTT
jgi:uncharacterized protein (TIRG00374 family)